MTHQNQSQDLPQGCYIPGLTPRPIACEECPSVTQPIEHYLNQGKHLFESGYYWEAHEFWEQAWIMTERQGPLSDLIKAHIKLAASGVKFLQQNHDGAVRHLRRAGELLQQASATEWKNELLGKPDEATFQQLIRISQMLQKKFPAIPPNIKELASVSGIRLLPELPPIVSASK